MAFRSPLAFQAPDSPKCIKRSSSTPAQRWWLREVVSDKSYGKGYYEVISGLVEVHDEPSAATQGKGVLRAGSRFMAMPQMVRGVVWLEIVDGGANPPVLALNDAAVDETCVWVQDNKTYIKRLRDISRERGTHTFSLCISPKSYYGGGKEWSKRPSTLATAGGAGLGGLSDTLPRRKSVSSLAELSQAPPSSAGTSPRSPTTPMSLTRTLRSAGSRSLRSAGSPKTLPPLEAPATQPALGA